VVELNVAGTIDDLCLSSLCLSSLASLCRLLFAMDLVFCIFSRAHYVLFLHIVIEYD